MKVVSDILLGVMLVGFGLLCVAFYQYAVPQWHWWLLDGMLFILSTWYSWTNLSLAYQGFILVTIPSIILWFLSFVSSVSEAREGYVVSN